MELQAMQRWKKEDEMIDEEIRKITDKTIEWKTRVKETGVLLDETDKKI